MTSPVRTRVAVAAGRFAAAASRRLGRGHGAIIGGRVTLALDPKALHRLTAGRPVVIITGTNGKTTTTRLTAEALRASYHVASNRGGNMPPGLIEAASDTSAEYLVLEVDELYVPQVLDATRAQVVVLLNLSRDQLDRITEIRRVAELWRSMLQRVDWPVAVIANCDDPLVVWAVGAHQPVRWVAGGYGWKDDATLCPECGRVRPIADDGNWTCTCGLNRPNAGRVPNLSLVMQLPGRFNLANAAVATAVAVELGVPEADAERRVAAVQDVAGRYATVQVAGRSVRLHLAKNPASWTETLDLIVSGRASAVLCLNARTADGMDTSWLWDVPFEGLQGRAVIASGDRRLDLSVRLRLARVDHTVAADPLSDVAKLPAGPIELLATYTAFHEVLDATGVVW